MEGSAMSDDRDALLTRAFGLAYFIQGDKAVACRITTNALAKLDVAAAAQSKRLYYKPAGYTRSGLASVRRFRTKVYMNDSQLLQHLVYIESDPYERRQEQSAAGALEEDDMLIRFIKHLVRITMRRNSFYVTLGLSRLLHNYSTAETRNIYHLLVQDPEPVKEESYYRGRKRELLQELRERFAPWVSMVRERGGEERFQSLDHPERQADFIQECLRLFTPWDTPCVVPEHLNPAARALPSLSFTGGNPDKEHPIEMGRMHSVLEPACYFRLTRALGLDPPQWRLAAPQFFLSNGNGQDRKPPKDRFQPPDLTEEDVTAIWTDLEGRAAQRRRAPAYLLSIVVDGVERARWDLRQSSRIRFEVDATAELIEVRAGTEDGEVPLAVHQLLVYELEEEAGPATFSITLEGGQKITFTVSATKDAVAEIAGAVVEVTYQETNLVRAVLLFWHQLTYRISGALLREDVGRVPALQTTLLLLLVCVGGILLYVRMGKQPGIQPLITTQPQLPKTLEKPLPSPPHAPPPESQEQRAESKEPASGPPLYARRSRPDALPGTAAAEADMTRTLPHRSAVESLRTVKRIHVESLGDDDLSHRIREAVLARLRASRRFAIAERPEKADAVLRGLAKQTDAGPVIAARLVDVEGRTIWTETFKSASRNTAGASDLGARVVRALLRDARRVQKRDP
jgi:hypothetical protein